MASANFALPPAARCERPSQASLKALWVHVGGLAQGPEEKRGLAGRDAGYSIAINAILSDMRPSLGKGVPPAELPNCPFSHKSRNVGFYTNCIAAEPNSEPIGNFASGQSVVAWRLGYAEVFLRIGSAQLSYFFIGDVTLDEHMHLAVSAHQSGINLVTPIDAQCLIERPLARINRNRPSAHGG